MKGISNQPLDNKRFENIEAARKYAFERIGSEAIVKETDEKGKEYFTLRSTDDKFINNFKKSKKQEVKHVLEFLNDSNNDGAKTNDYLLRNQSGKLEKAAKIDINSGLIKTPEEKAIEKFHEILADQHNCLWRLSELSPEYIGLLIKSKSDVLTESDHKFINTHLNTPEVNNAIKVFTGFFDTRTPLNATGENDFKKIITKLNDPKTIKNISVLQEIAKHPDKFNQAFKDDQNKMISLAQTLKEMPGFEKFPQAINGDTKSKRTYEDAIISMGTYKFKFSLTYGFDFNQNGVTTQNTELKYRLGKHIFSLGLSGSEPYNFSNINFNEFAYQDSVPDATSRYSFGYASGILDMKLSLAKDPSGKVYLEKPTSNTADRYLGRVGDDVGDWAKDHPGITAGVITGVVGAAYLYSKANPEQELSIPFGLHQTLIKREDHSLRGAITPELKMKDGNMRLAVKDFGLGYSGTHETQFYDISAKHEFNTDDGNYTNEETDLNLRYGWGKNTFTLDEKYTYTESMLNSTLGYKKDFLHSPGFSSYLKPYTTFQNDKFYDAGLVLGAQKQLGSNFSLSGNIGTSTQNSVFGGLSVTKQF